MVLRHCQLMYRLTEDRTRYTFMVYYILCSTWCPLMQTVDAQETSATLSEMNTGIILTSYVAVQSLERVWARDIYINDTNFGSSLHR